MPGLWAYQMRASTLVVEKQIRAARHQARRPCTTAWCDQISTPAENQLRFTVPSTDTVFLRLSLVSTNRHHATDHLFPKGAARALLLCLLEARCRLSAVVLLIEDLHWIDSVSQEVLGKIVDGEAKLRLLILHTRRPEYEPPWREKPVATTLRLELLPAGEIRRLVQARLGVEAPPKALVRLVTEKAEGNALFAEEILSFLTERGVLRTVGGNVEFDAGAVGAALPASVQSLLTARVDRLAPQDRAVLQAAAVIGRRFDPQLLAAAADVGGDVDARLAAMRALDLVHSEGKSGEYAFKHALVRDALYQSLLTGPRAALHLKIAEEIERRSGNSLAEVMETLAHHYS